MLVREIEPKFWNHISQIGLIEYRLLKTIYISLVFFLGGVDEGNLPVFSSPNFILEVSDQEWN